MTLNGVYVIFSTFYANLGILSLVTDNLVVPIVVHGLYDFLALIYLVRWRKGKGRSSGKTTFTR